MIKNSNYMFQLVVDNPAGLHRAGIQIGRRRIDRCTRGLKRDTQRRLNAIWSRSISRDIAEVTRTNKTPENRRRLPNHVVIC